MYVGYFFPPDFLSPDDILLSVVSPAWSLSHNEFQSNTLRTASRIMFPEVPYSSRERKKERWATLLLHDFTIISVCHPQ